MSRSWDGESDDPLDWGRYYAALKSSLEGRRGQQLLRDLVAALDALPVPELVDGYLVDPETGCNCALGAVGLHRGIPPEQLLAEQESEDLDPSALAEMFDISVTLANEVVDLNDNYLGGVPDSPHTRQGRWQMMRDWAEKRLLTA